jgi:hypothetical protein
MPNGDWLFAAENFFVFAAKTVLVVGIYRLGESPGRRGLAGEKILNFAAKTVWVVGRSN